MDPRSFIEMLRESPANSNALVEVRELEARDARPGPFPETIPPVVTGRMEMIGVQGLYDHQREALAHLEAGRNVIVATGTASGKTLIYNLEFARAVTGAPKATALYLFPTKALARDQLRQVRALKLPQIKAAVYDGDTPQPERALIRKNANLVMTNPDMLHLALLADHVRWADFFLRLSLVVVDEAHVARGVFGSHIAMVLRRLRRLVAHYGGSPKFVLTSATVGNPKELAERLAGLPFESVTTDGSPAGEKLFALWNPPIVDEESGARRSPLTEGSMLVRELTEAGIKSIAFARSRRAAELLADFARRELPPSLKPKVKAYRAGYLPEERRRIEVALSSGDILAVASTNALELGIDIGSLDAAVLVGYPGTRASMWQQAGRAGRASEGSLAIMIAQDDPLDQYLVSHPEDLFDKPPEAAVLDPTNPFILEPHIACAARELPLRQEELVFFGASEVVEPAVEALAARGELVQRKGIWHHKGRATPHRDVDIRSSSGATFAIVIEETGELLGSVDESRAYVHVHPGAIYLHQGEQFEVSELDLQVKVALVAPSNADFYTQSRDVTDISVTDVISETQIGETKVSYGKVTVTTQITGFVRKALASGQVIDTVPLDLPAQTLSTRSLWLAIPEEVIAGAALKPPQIPGAAHAAEHAAIGLLPLIATCDRWDIGGLSTPWHADTQACAIFIYDAYQGGAGITERGFGSAERLLRATLETVRNCPCGHGCPGCVQSPKCGNGNEPLDKTGAVSLLGAILGERWG